MNSEINLLIDQIKRPLQEGIISDRKEYDKLVKDIISQSPELQKVYNKHRFNLGDFCRESSHEVKLEKVTKYIEYLLTQFPKQEETPIKTLSQSITQQDRDDLSKLGYTKPPQGVLRRGSYAIKIACEIFGINHKHIVANDTDAYLTPEYQGNKEKLAQTHNSDTIGFIYTTGDISKLINQADLTLNQVIILEDTIYYTLGFLAATNTKISEISNINHVDIFGRCFYYSDEYKIYTSRALHRGYKALMEGKINKLKLPGYIIDPANIKLIYNSNHSLTLLKKIVNKRDPIIGSQILYNLSLIFQKVQIIEKDSNIFDYFDTLLQENTYINMQPRFLDNAFELNRMMKKLIKHILDLEGYHEFDVSKIDTSDTSEIILTIPQQEVPQEFIEKFVERKEQVLQKKY